MKLRRPIYTRLARAELDEIIATIAFHAGRRTAAKWRRRIRDAAVRLAEFPYLGAADEAQLGPGRRRWVVEPYLIVYRVEPDRSVTVLRIVHGARDLPALFGASNDD